MESTYGGYNDFQPPRDEGTRNLTEAIKYLEDVMIRVAPQNQITWKGKSEELKETTNI